MDLKGTLSHKWII